MKDINNIDELLRQGFEGFNPEPPADAWQAIQQSIANQPLVQPTPDNAVVNSGSMVAKIKGIAIAGKVAIGLTTVGAITGLFYFAEPKKNIEISKPDITVESIESIPISEHIDYSSLNDSGFVVSKPESKVQIVKIATEKKAEAKKVKHIQLPDDGIVVSDDLKEQIKQPNILNTENKKSEVKKELKETTENISVLPLPEKQKETNDLHTEKPIVYNFITPNGDGQNDYLELVIRNESYFKLTILDINNKVVFESLSAENKWNGNYMNENIECAVGQYHYVLQYSYKNQKEIKSTSGFISLRR